MAEYYSNYNYMFGYNSSQYVSDAGCSSYSGYPNQTFQYSNSWTTERHSDFSSGMLSTRGHMPL